LIYFTAHVERSKAGSNLLHERPLPLKWCAYTLHWSSLFRSLCSHDIVSGRAIVNVVRQIGRSTFDKSSVAC